MIDKLVIFNCNILERKRKKESSSGVSEKGGVMYDWLNVWVIDLLWVYEDWVEWLNEDDKERAPEREML